ncbi:helix-turn-helix transcriptional regulator [Paenibacillus sp. 2KB_20]|uniref:helix-turn-helix transcriptional regulator n=1 Tax=Paenibacillus sp. 2KB_20 TaxID=3232977 RepID=UPI003F989276
MVENRIRELRSERDITQLQMAKDLEITRQTIISIEKKQYNPSLELALRIACYFDCTVEDIFTLKEE